MFAVGQAEGSDELTRSKELLSRIETLKIEFSNMRSEIASLQSDKSSLQSELNKCTSELLQSTQQVEQIKTRLEDIEKLMKNQADASALQIAQISELKANQASINKKNEELTNETQLLGKKTKDMEKETELCRAKIKNNESKQSDDLDFVITQYESKIFQLESSNASLRSRGREHENKITQLEGRLLKTTQKLTAICPSCEID